MKPKVPVLYFIFNNPQLFFKKSPLKLRFYQKLTFIWDSLSHYFLDNFFVI